MNVVAGEHRKEKARRDYKWKEERTDLQRNLAIFNDLLKQIIFLLIICAMIGVGIFTKLLFLD